MEGLRRRLSDLTGFSEQADLDRRHDVSTFYARIDSLENDSLKSRIDSLETRLIGSRGSMPHTDADGDGTGHPRVDGIPSRGRDDELTQLRFQAVNLEHQLGKGVDQVNESNGARPSYRHARSHKAKWRFWRSKKRRNPSS